MPEKASSGRLILVDGSGFIFRAYHALPPLTRPDGTPVGAVYGFVGMLAKLLEDHRGADPANTYLAVIFDAARHTFRNDLYPAYKANRDEPPEDLIPQFGLIREATRAFGLPCVEQEGFEADDLIATYAKAAAADGLEVLIVSGDKDLMQLVDARVGMLDPVKNKRIAAPEVEEKFGVPPAKVAEVQALAGDSVDNVPGVPGIGVKTAAQLIHEYGDLETLLAKAAGIKQPKRRENLLNHADEARVSLQLVTLRDDVPVEETYAAFAWREPDPAVLRPFLEEQGFRTLQTRLETLLGDTAPAPSQDVAVEGYRLIQDEAALADVIALCKVAGIMAVDTETDRLSAMQGGLVGISLAWGPGHAAYIPLAHRNPDAGGDLLDGGGETTPPKQLPVKDTLSKLALLFTDPAVLKVGQNIKYDLHVLRRAGAAVGVDLSAIAPIDDTMVLSYVLDGSLHGHGMDELARLHLGHATIPFSAVCGKGKDRITFDLVPLDKALAYAAEDADVTLRLYHVLRPRLVAEKMVTVHERLERPVIGVLTAMEAEGVLVDATELRALSADFAKRMADLDATIQTLAGRSFNVGSPKQLGEILFEDMGLPGGKKTKTGAYATGADVLEELAAQGHDLPQKVLDWRQLSKLRSTYTEALIEAINPTTKRVHTTLAQTVAGTGRLSSNDPNLQNIPIRTEEGRRIRKAFIAAPGHVLLAADYSQIELRLLAHVADIAALKQAFAEGLDIHAMTASAVFGIPLEGMDPMVRRRAKAINFGIIYGISAFGLARQLGIAQSEARDTIEAYFAKFPGIKDYMEATKTFAREHGFVRTPFGRKCYTPGIKEKNPAHRAFAERAAINAPLQGGAADIIKRAMVALPPALENDGLRGRMLLQVHDELLFEVPDAEADAVAALAQRVMEDAATLSVPLTVAVGRGASWAEAH